MSKRMSTKRVSGVFTAALVALALLAAPGYAVETLISDLTPETYQAALFEEGSLYFVDRTFTLLSMPEGFTQMPGIMTANNDRTVTDPVHITFTLGFTSDVYVAFDPRRTPPNWLTENFTQTDLTVDVSDEGQGYAELYVRRYETGEEVILGGRDAEGAGGEGIGSNYFVFVQPVRAWPIFTVEPGNAITEVGQTIELSAELNQPEGTAIYQWYKDGEPISGANSPTLSITVDDASAGVYWAVVTDDSEYGPYTTRQIRVSVFEELPLGGALALALIGGATLAGGVIVLRRRRN